MVSFERNKNVYCNLKLVDIFMFSLRFFVLYQESSNKSYLKIVSTADYSIAGLCTTFTAVLLIL